MEENKKCPKCGGEMEKGFAVDRGHFSMPSQQRWIKKIKLLSDDSLSIDTYRCKACGYLESYAK